MDSWILLTLMVLSSCCCYGSLSCPHVCTCHFSSNATEVACSNITFAVFPYDRLPSNTTSLFIEFTNLSSIFAHQLEAVPLLQELHLSGNQLRSLPEDFLQGLVHLHTLDLTGNRLEHLPAAVFNHAPLVNLVLRDNMLLTADAEWLPASSNITWLDLGGNRLSSMPTKLLQELTRLERLDLSNNLLEKLPAGILDSLPHLQRLHLERNRLSSVDQSTFQHSSNLTHLFLQENQLYKLPAALFQGLHHLDVLSLNDNQLRSLPSGLLDKLPALGCGAGQGVDLSQNPWECKADVVYLWKWLRDHQKVVFFPENIQCDSPESLRGRPILHLTEEELKTE
ncbi:leucine-rich alpha-2-glycoprotein [Brienomyrus brachyistius]|uniref:leucine-rich alpha-2-glycoprotein n=1 Tax=Brienomyrus brachyistius TaxID=42636 RepID=UPI0020B38E0D|nr:leucine-rich alpha-2-glycoprotein [Brienomyrus brachyistius]